MEEVISQQNSEAPQTDKKRQIKYKQHLENTILRGRWPQTEGPACVTLLGQDTANNNINNPHAGLLYALYTYHKTQLFTENLN